ncbi:hypothetical protein RRG08_024545 [Elysia crispata]|uniref:Reverse transcriptase domain-containing protein n=1 Tax=Elysia crispata TaxID=231223 RepID=A0AAE1A6C9_9GAST|nr:hypothetical protein RRG08_024545 [Elysia crispata]
MGCTISSILFVMALEVILKAAEDSAGSASPGSGCYVPPLKAFMEDTAIICSKEDETRRMLERLDVLMAWCRMNSNQRGLAVSQRVQKAVQQPQQRQWTNWDNAREKSLTWNEIWHMVRLRISFLIRSVHDFLPSNAKAASTQQLIMVELTVPYEDRMEEAHIYKR